MSVFFVVSDIHSFCAELRGALGGAGFDSGNPEHSLIVCGDVFDRGPDPIGVYEFLSSIPKERVILIRGNHERLLAELLEKSFPQRHDFMNGTVDTVCDLAGYGRGAFDALTYVEKAAAWAGIAEKAKGSDAAKWALSGDWRDFHEMGRFIFVHGFIPTRLSPGADPRLTTCCYNSASGREYYGGWREGDWDDASWGCPWEQYKAGLFKPEEDAGKTLVCGHWHTSDFYLKLKGIGDYYNAPGPIYYSRGIIGIDGGVSFSLDTMGYVHPQNVMVIDESGRCLAYDPGKRGLVELREEKDRWGEGKSI